VVAHKGDPVRIEHRVRAHGAEGLDGKGGGDVVGKDEGHPAPDNLPGLANGFVCGALQYLLR
jgi:hypothetical protein